MIFFEHSQKYVLSKKAELWSADCEEFLYLLDIPQLTLAQYERWRDYIQKDGMRRMHIGPGYMYSYITSVFICDEDARKALKICRIYKSFHFSLHGWIDYHVAVVDLSKGRVDANCSSHDTAKILKKVLYSRTNNIEGRELGMNSLVLLIVCIAVLVVGNIFYGGWLCSVVENKEETPAHSMEDGVDYVPAKAPVLMGHHFSSEEK